MKYGNGRTGKYQWDNHLNPHEMTAGRQRTKS